MAVRVALPEGQSSMGGEENTGTGSYQRDLERKRTLARILRPPSAASPQPPTSPSGPPQPLDPEEAKRRLGDYLTSVRPLLSEESYVNFTEALAIRELAGLSLDITDPAFQNFIQSFVINEQREVRPATSNPRRLTF